MELGKVAGQVVSTVRTETLPPNSLLLVDLLDQHGKPAGRQVALDRLGAGEGEWVLLVRGSSARKVCAEDAAVDLAVVGIVDQVSGGGDTIYSKNESRTARKGRT